MTSVYCFLHNCVFIYSFDAFNEKLQCQYIVMRKKENTFNV